MTTIVLSTEGERVEMGGIVDPDKGALIYRKTTEVETVEPEPGSEFSRKKIKKITSETTWLGNKRKPDKKPLVENEEVKPWHDDEIEMNPLYSTSDYISDFNNPLYTNRLSAAEGAAIAASESFEQSDMEPGKGHSGVSQGRPGSSDKGEEHVDYLSAQPDLKDGDTADTLF